MLYSGILWETFHFLHKKIVFLIQLNEHSLFTLQIGSTHNPNANINIIILLLAMATSRYPNSGQK